MSRKIFLDAPNVGQREKECVNEAIDSGFVSTVGPFVGKFEKIFSDYLDAEGAVSTQSGTAALHMSLYELGVGSGDEVIVPALTFVATVNPIIYLGAKPIFVDVDLDTWTMDPGEIEKSITPKTKAIIPVHLYGNPCNIMAIMDIAKKYNLYVIEDATESLGALYKQRHTGTFGDLGCFSFNGNKTITTGGGGMVVGNDIKRIEHIKFLINQAKDESSGCFHPEIGFNYRITNIEAALGIAQMEFLDDFVAKKKNFNNIYREELSNIDSVSFQKEYPDSQSSWWLTCIYFKKDINIVKFMKKLKDKDIPTRRIFMPMVEFSPYKSYKKAKLDNSYRIYERGICLPSSTLNKDEDIHYVCKVIKDFINAK